MPVQRLVTGVNAADLQRRLAQLSPRVNHSRPQLIIMRPEPLRPSADTRRPSAGSRLHSIKLDHPDNWVNPKRVTGVNNIPNHT